MKPRGREFESFRVPDETKWLPPQAAIFYFF